MPGHQQLTDERVVATRDAPLHSALQAMIQAARHHGVELDPNEFPKTPKDTVPSAAALSQWAQSAGIWSRAVRLRWRHLLRFQDASPVVLLFTDGSAGLLTGANPEQNVVFIANPNAPAGTASRAVDEWREYGMAKPCCCAPPAAS
jgi:subfamily B ATP-binding cassette protein HlyB/CyaB